MIGACGANWATEFAHGIYNWTLGIANWIAELPSSTIVMPHIANMAMACFIIGLTCIIFIRATRLRENFILGAIFICAGLVITVTQPTPIFMSTHDNELVAMRRADGEL